MGSRGKLSGGGIPCALNSQSVRYEVGLYENTHSENPPLRPLVLGLGFLCFGFGVLGLMYLLIVNATVN